MPSLFDTSQGRLLLSGAIMMMPFGLIFSIPDIAYNKKWFPSTRLMVTLHLEACANSAMLIGVGTMMPHLHYSSKVAQLIMESAMHLGAWMNVFPWLYGGITGAVTKNPSGSNQLQLDQEPPPNNDQLMGNIGKMLGLCVLGDVVGWSLVIYGLFSKHNQN
jgi:hypothetical protein